MSKRRCVIFDGPFPTQDRHGEEVPEWYVGEGDDDGEDIGEGSHFTSYEAGFTEARRLADRLNVELVNEAMRA